MLNGSLPICNVAPFSTKLLAINFPILSSTSVKTSGLCSGNSFSPSTKASKWETWTVASPKVLGNRGFTCPTEGIKKKREE